MEEEIVFSEHAVLRVKERTSLTEEELSTRLTERVSVLVTKTITQPFFRYCVVWDTVKDAPLLIILRSMDQRTWTVVTVYETMTYQKRGHNVMVMPSHIELARKLEARFMKKQRRQGEAVPSGHVRLHIVVRFDDHGKPKVRRHKIGSVPAGQFFITYGGDVEKLVRYFVELGRVSDVFVPADSTVEAEVLRVENHTRTIVGNLTLG